MQRVKIYDTIFSHLPYSCLNGRSQYFEWDVNPSVIEDGEVVFFTDNSLEKARELSKKNIIRYGWLIESPAIIDQSGIVEYLDILDAVFTCRKDFLESSPKFKFLPLWCSWIKYKDRMIYKKSKLVSIIASSQNETNGHILRHDVVSKYKDRINVMGSGYKYIEDKLEGLKDYMFSVVIENTKQDYYFSEKLLDCFTTGTIPIYWGCPSIGDFFNKAGILTFNTIHELGEILYTLSNDKYNSFNGPIIDNFQQATKYGTTEDFLINYDGLFKKIFNSYS